MLFSMLSRRRSPCCCQRNTQQSQVCVRYVSSVPGVCASRVGRGRLRGIERPRYPDSVCYIGIYVFFSRPFSVTISFSLGSWRVKITALRNLLFVQRYYITFFFCVCVSVLFLNCLWRRGSGWLYFSQPLNFHAEENVNRQFQANYSEAESTPELGK